jgi:ABC-2 type transport system ATP-binding protein
MITIDGVSKRFGQIVAVDRLSCRIERGEVVGFLGPNGAGKSTTMRMLAGSLEPDEGSVVFDGRPIADDVRDAKRRIGFLAEANPVYDDMLVAEFLGYVSAVRGLTRADAREAVARAVDETDIANVFYRTIGELSKGFRQRTGLAAAILHRPELLILDEPTEGLDPNQRVDIRKLIADLGRERTVVLSTHVLQEVEAMCTRLLVLANGKLVAQGTIAEVRASRAGTATYVFDVEGEHADAYVAQMSGVTSVTTERAGGRTRWRVEAAGDLELRPQLFALARDRGWSVWELHREQTSLEVLFRGLTAANERARHTEDDEPAVTSGDGT